MSAMASPSSSSFRELTEQLTASSAFSDLSESSAFHSVVGQPIRSMQVLLLPVLPAEDAQGGCHC